jgi:hypothetical protein
VRSAVASERPQLRSPASRRPHDTSAHAAARSPKDWGSPGGGKEGVVAPTMSAGGRRRRVREWQPDPPQEAWGGRSLTYRPGWTVNEIPSTLDSLGGVGSGICGSDLRRSGKRGSLVLFFLAFFSFFLARSPRPRLDRSPAYPSATPVTQVAVVRIRGGVETAPPNAKSDTSGSGLRLCCGMAGEWRIATAFGVPSPSPARWRGSERFLMRMNATGVGWASSTLQHVVNGGGRVVSLQDS